MSLDHPIIVVGSGPAGVSASFPLVEAGLSVLMMDVGYEPDTHPPLTGSLLSIRQHEPKQAEFFYGKSFEALLAPKGQSPKLRSPQHQYVYRDFSERYRIKTENFSVTGSLAQGGLSNAWGAICYTYTQSEMGLSLANYQRLQHSYERIARRIGISGPMQNDFTTQPALSLHPACAELLKRYQQRKKNTLELTQPHSAVLTRNQDDRLACQLDNTCLWHCASQSIYSARFDLKKLRAHPHFEYRPKLFLKKIIKIEGGYQLIAEHTHTQEIVKLTCHTLILAAGTLGSTALVLDYTQSFEKPIALKSNPCFAMAFVQPKRLGAAITERSYGMGQLRFSVPIAERAQKAVGTLYSAEGLLAQELIHFMPFSRKGAIKINKYLTPALLLANCFLPGNYSAHTVALNDEGELKIVGGQSSDCEKTMQQLKKSIRQHFQAIGAYYVPSSYKIPLPGSDIHYAGTLPMQSDKRSLTVNHCGQLAGEENFYIVDGAILPTLPEKNLTFTMMANADRIGQFLSRITHQKCVSSTCS